jgi:hypothetical protein
VVGMHFDCNLVMSVKNAACHWSRRLHRRGMVPPSVTTRKGPADDSGVRETTTIEAMRP